MPGEEGIWFFILGDMLVFSLFFATFMYYRGDAPAVFAASQASLDQGFGVLNTFLMLSSSWFVATGVQAARRGASVAAPWCFAFAIACGAAFAVVKFLEYGAKLRAGITLNSNDFYMFYYMFTGIHFLHVLIGMGVLAYMLRIALPAARHAGTLRNLESGASFWHVVDVLWIVLFAIFYLLR